MVPARLPGKPYPGRALLPWGVLPFASHIPLKHLPEGAPGCRWALQGIFGNELRGIQYSGPVSCISTGLPGATEEDIKQVIPLLWPRPALHCASSVREAELAARRVHRHKAQPHCADAILAPWASSLKPWFLLTLDTPLK